MDNNDRSKFAEAMTGLGEIYGKTVSGILLEMYFDALKKYDLPTVGRAVRDYYTSEKSTFFPKPGELITLIEGGSEDRAIQAWSKVDKAVRSVGSYTSIVFDDKVIMSTIDQMGGWVQLCASKDDIDHKFNGERFKKAYRGNLRNDNLKHPAKLFGICDSENNHRFGKSSEAVAMIGSPDICKEVMRLGNDKPMIRSTLVKLDSVDDLAATLGITKQ